MRTRKFMDTLSEKITFPNLSNVPTTFPFFFFTWLNKFYRVQTTLLKNDWKRHKIYTMSKSLIFLFSSFFSCLLLNSFVLIFPSSFWGLVSNIFSSFFNLLLVFQYLVFFFSPLFLVGAPHFFFFCLWSQVLVFLLSASLAGVAQLLFIYSFIFVFWSEFLYFQLSPSLAGVAQLFFFFFYLLLSWGSYCSSYVLSLPPERTVA